MIRRYENYVADVCLCKFSHTCLSLVFFALTKEFPKLVEHNKNPTKHWRKKIRTNLRDLYARTSILKIPAIKTTGKFYLERN